MRLLCVILLLGFLASCDRADRTITQSAQDQAAWTRQLEIAIPVGISGDSAEATMTRNGFKCHSGVDSVAYLWCDKSSSKRDIVRERWQAVINLNRGMVSERRAFFGLIGP